MTTAGIALSGTAGKLIGARGVGATGFEPATSWSQTKRSTKLSYAPYSRKPSDGYYARIKPNGKEFRLTPGGAGL